MKKNYGSAMIVLVTVLLLLSSCKKDSEENLPDEPVPVALTAHQVSIIESQNSFAFDFFKKINENSDESENIIVSPFSISLALSMALNGADGTTREAMIEALRVNGLNPENINISFKDLTEALLNVDKRVLISIANSVWTEDSFTAKKPFTDILTDYYKAQAESFDINDPQAPEKINNWIETNTNGLIDKMIEELNSNTVMLLINAIYFKGKWNSQFNKDKTFQAEFEKSNGVASDVPMMKQVSDFKIYSGPNFKVAELPYGQGNFVMDVILPEEPAGIDDMIGNLDGETFNEWLGNMGTNEVDLSFPRFKYGYKENLKTILSDMGMGIAFTESADFSNISDTPLLINDVVHQAFIETNEEGTEAAAATIVDIGLTSMPMTVIFNADHPFIYVIRETTTNTILFMGKVADPTN
jgi:serpin B